MKKYLGFVLLVPVIAWAAPQSVECPATLDVKSSANPPAGWQVVTPSTGNSLDRIGFYSGQPSEQASLVPDKTQTKKGESQDVWTFPSSATEIIWSACFYTGTTLIIAKPLEQGTKNCSVRYKVTRSGSRLSVIEAHCE